MRRDGMRAVSRQPKVAIIGAGLGGVAMAVNLRRARIHNFTIFEQSAGAGGTWWDNRYPGAAVDTESEIYSYSFKPHVWDRTHATQPELQAYVDAVVDDFGLRPHLRLQTRVVRAEWDDDHQQFLVTTDGGERHAFDFVVSAVGQLNHPRLPAWPGLERFAGPAFHTARWESQHDLTARRVGVVGTGSTAAQLVPALAPHVEELVLFQRSPGWVLPKGERELTKAEKHRMRRSTGRRRVRRLKALMQLERLRGTANLGSKQNVLIRQTALDYIAETVTDPALRAQVTPDYPFYCKRPVLASDFYPALSRPNVRVISSAVASVTEHAVVDDDGVEHPLDALIMATGFQPTRFLATVEVTGTGGRTLHEVWGEEPEAFLGVGVPGFPNFFMLYGPATNGGAVIFSLERQAEWATRVIRHAWRAGQPFEVNQALHDRFNRWIDGANVGKAWTGGGCSNYFSAPTGRIVTQWPFGQVLYAALLRLADPRLVGHLLPRAPHAGQLTVGAPRRDGVEAGSAASPVDPLG